MGRPPAAQGTQRPRPECTVPHYAPASLEPRYEVSTRSLLEELESGWALTTRWGASDGGPSLSQNPLKTREM